MSDLCIECGLLVRPRQHAITCDLCDRWQHRICGNTGVSQSEYFRAVRDQVDIAFTCNPCTSRQCGATINISTDGNGNPASPTRVESPHGNMQHTANSDLESSIEELETSISQLHLRRTPSDSDSDDMDDIRIPSHLNKTYVIRSSKDGHDSHDDATSDENELDIARYGLTDVNDMYGSFLEESQLTDTILEDTEVNFEVVEQGSNRGNKKLVSSDGYSYCVKKQTASSTYWRCSVRSKYHMCYAKVTQKGDIFRRVETHNHLPEPFVMKRILIKRDIKREAVRDIHAPAGKIVKDKMLETFERTDFNLPNPDALKKIVNRARQKTRLPEREKSVGN